MKTYLKDLTLDEVIDKLKSGESIKYATSDAETKYRDNMLLTILPDGKYTINVQISSCLNRVAYFETPDELKLEVGKCYKTRDGRKAFVSVVDDTYAYGIIEDDRLVTIWIQNGVCDTDDRDDDLISEWSDDDVEKD
jgi:hypothetical protein